MSEQKIEVKCGFFDAINYDRLYSADDMNRPYRRLVSNGVFATNKGVPSTDLQVFTANDGMNIIVKKGEGIFDYKWFENPTDIIFTVTANNDVLTRVDSIIVQIDKNQNGRNGYIIYREGVPSESLQPPELNNTELVSEYRIANIHVTPTTNIIGQESIVDLRGSEECLWVTGLIDQVDTSTLFSQYQGWLQKTTKEAEQGLEKQKEIFEKDFNEWFKTVQTTLSGDVAGNLFNLINENALKSKTITLSVDGWQLNEETQEYEYTVEDDIVTKNHVVDGKMDLKNQEKMSGGGYIESNDGNFKVIVSEIPDEEIIMNIFIQKVQMTGGSA